MQDSNGLLACDVHALNPVRPRANKHYSPGSYQNVAVDSVTERVCQRRHCCIAVVCVIIKTWYTVTYAYVGMKFDFTYSMAHAFKHKLMQGIVSASQKINSFVSASPSIHHLQSRFAPMACIRTCPKCQERGSNGVLLCEEQSPWSHTYLTIDKGLCKHDTAFGTRLIWSHRLDIRK